MNLLKRAKQFIDQNWDRTSPLLLGYSGGPDSKALLHLLLDAGVNTLHLAHLDHGWREESREEAASLALEAKELGLFFHSKRLDNVPTKNLEDHGRKERLIFFRSLFKKYPFQALLLGSHGDDLAETSLKRIFEGAHLPFLEGFSSKTMYEEMPIWRPLASARKNELLTYLKRKKLTALFDKTNEDLRFLRARLRGELIPFITETFGKEITDNLIQLSARAGELKEYLGRKTEKVIREGTPLSQLERIEARFAIQQMAQAEKVSISRDLLEQLLDAVYSGGRTRQFHCRGRALVVEQGRIHWE